MSKKFNGHRCERRNLTDLVLGTGPTGKKRPKPKAKKRAKNYTQEPAANKMANGGPSSPVNALLGILGNQGMPGSTRSGNMPVDTQALMQYVNAAQGRITAGMSPGDAANSNAFVMQQQMDQGLPATAQALYGVEQKMYYGGPSGDSPEVMAPSSTAVAMPGMPQQALNQSMIPDVEYRVPTKEHEQFNRDTRNKQITTELAAFRKRMENGEESLEEDALELFPVLSTILGADDAMRAAKDLRENGFIDNPAVYDDILDIVSAAPVGGWLGKGAKVKLARARYAGKGLVNLGDVAKVGRQAHNTVKGIGFGLDRTEDERGINNRYGGVPKAQFGLPTTGIPGLNLGQGMMGGLDGSGGYQFPTGQQLIQNHLASTGQSPTNGYSLENYLGETRGFPTTGGLQDYDPGFASEAFQGIVDNIGGIPSAGGEDVTSGLTALAMGQETMPGLMAKMNSKQGMGNLVQTGVGALGSYFSSEAVDPRSLADSTRFYKQDGFNATLGDAFSGAAKGMKLGPMGALAGAAANVMLGRDQRLQAKDNYIENEEESRIARGEFNEALAADRAAMNYGAFNEQGNFTNPFGTMMRMGGSPDYETEKNEIILASPNDKPVAMTGRPYQQLSTNVYKGQGPSHEAGGIPTKGATAPFTDSSGASHDSPYVFSDDASMKLDPTEFLKMIS